MNNKSILSKWYSKYIKYILDNPDLDWDFEYLSNNSNITWEIVQTYPDLPWSFGVGLGLGLGLVSS